MAENGSALYLFGIVAPRDPNGNLRGGWLVYDGRNGDLVGFLDDGLEGRSALDRLRNNTKKRLVLLGTVAVAPFEYREARTYKQL